MKRKEKLLSIVFVVVCFAICFFTYKAYQRYAGNNEEEINLGMEVIDDGSLGGGGGSPKPTTSTKPSSTPKAKLSPPCCDTVNNTTVDSDYGCAYCTNCVAGACPTPTPTATPSCKSYDSAGTCPNGCAWSSSYGCVIDEVPSDGCSAGEGVSVSGEGRKCVACADGYYSEGGINACTYCVGEVSSDKTSCNKCDGENQYLSDGKCATCFGVLSSDINGKKSCNACTISVSAADKTGPSTQEIGAIAGRYTTSNCSASGLNMLITLSVSGAKLAGDASRTVGNGDIRIVSAPACGTVSITATVTMGKNGTELGSASATKSISTGGVWIDGKNGTFKKRPTFSEEGANVSGEDLWAGSKECHDDTNSDGDPVVVCDSYRSRSCPGDAPVKTMHNYCCASNGIPSLSKYAFDVKGVETLDCNKYAAQNNAPDDIEYTLLENFDRNKCHPPQTIAGECTKNSLDPSPKNVSASECEQDVSMTIDDGVKCTNVSETVNNTFYKIDCSKTITTSFDYGNDNNKNTARTLYAGEGFAYGISVSTVKDCTFEFYEDKWSVPYEKALKNIENVDPKLKEYAKDNNWDAFGAYINNTILKIKGVKQASLLFEWWRKLEYLKDVVRNYNSYGKDDVFNEKIENFAVETTENGSLVSTKYKFDKVSVNEGVFKETNKVEKKLGVKGLSNPYNYKSSNTNNPRKVTFAPTKVCVKKSTGEILSPKDNGDCPDGSINGGNKIYIGYNKDLSNSSKTYSIKITVSGLGTNNSKVVNNMCNLRTLPLTIQYRPIDVSNPFINNSWKKGQNWVNSKYDFTRVIHATTWSETTYNTIKIPGDDIAAIKKSNSDYASDSPYLGLCNRVNPDSQDLITRKICGLIK